MKNVRLYACGGMGMNIGSSMTPDLFDICYLDSSKSSVNNNVNPEQATYVEGVKGTGGSGGHRANNYRVITAAMPGHMDRFQPADLNIVVFSLSGGTGSVAGPLILRELLKGGHPAVAVVVGDPTSDKYLNNSIDTLKSLEGISAATGLPLVMCYHLNGTTTWGDVNEDIHYSIQALALLGSQDNAELDVMDVTNFFQYTQVVSAPNQLACLDIFDSRQLASKAIEPIAIASLYVDREQYINFGDARYSTYGFPNSGDLLGGEQIHFVINHANVEPIKVELDDYKTELSRKYSAHKQRKSLVQPDDNIDENGMVI